MLGKQLTLLQAVGLLVQYMLVGIGFSIVIYYTEPLSGSESDILRVIGGIFVMVLTIRLMWIQLFRDVSDEDVEQHVRTIYEIK